MPRECRTFLGTTSAKRIDTMVRGVLTETIEHGDFNPRINTELEYHIKKLREFLYERVYDNIIVHSDFIKCAKIIHELYAYFLGNPGMFLKEIERTDFYDEPENCVCDFVASMTDRYAFSLFERIFLPMPWKIPS